MAVAVKICGLREESDAKFAIEAGADYLGFVFEPNTPRYVGAPDWSPKWLEDLQVPKVAVYGNFQADQPELFDVVQSVEWNRLPSQDVRHFRVLRVREDGVEDMFANVRPGDAVVLDAFEPGTYGGTGKTLDWAFAARIVEKLSGIRVFLAGGLTPENVQEAISIVKPFGVDVSSGVESSPGIKDPAKVTAFLRAVKPNL